MGQSKKEDRTAVTQRAAERFKFLRDRAGLSQLELVAKMKERGLGLSQKSVSNIETTAVDTGFGNLANLADFYRIPLWVVFLPDLTTEMLEGDRVKRLIKLMDDYLACDDTSRTLIEDVAGGYAGLASKE